MDELREALLKFRNDRDWEQFHNAKDLALALNVEAGELLELFLWKDAQQANPEKVKELESRLMAYLESVHAEILYPPMNAKQKSKSKDVDD